MWVSQPSNLTQCNLIHRAAPSRAAPPTGLQEFGEKASVGISGRTSPVLFSRPRMTFMRVPLRSHPCGDRGMKIRGRRGRISPASSWVVITDSQISLTFSSCYRGKLSTTRLAPTMPLHPRPPPPTATAHPNTPAAPCLSQPGPPTLALPALLNQRTPSPSAHLGLTRYPTPSNRPSTPCPYQCPPPNQPPCSPPSRSLGVT